MIPRVFRVGERQAAGLQIYVLDPVLQEPLFDDDSPPFPGDLGADGLRITDMDLAWRLIVDGANRADDEGDGELRDALTALGSRVIRAKDTP